MSWLEKRRFLIRISILSLLFFLLILAFIIGIATGKYMISVSDIIETLLGGGTELSNLALFEFRLPRLYLAFLVGIGMGTSGVVMQSLLHNDLASPGTLGVADGSSLFVSLYVAWAAGKIEHPILLPLSAFIGGVISAILIYKLGIKKKTPLSPVHLVMTGVAMSAVYSASITFLMYILDETQLEMIQRWQSGELWATNGNSLILLTGWLVLCEMLLLSQTYKLNTIQLGYEMATSLGVHVKKDFVVLSFLAIAISSASVAFGGNFFFLGLIGPHIARKLVGVDTRFLIPAAGIVSALLLIISVILVENVSVFVNVPAGIVISLLSVPYFIYLLMKVE